MTRRLSTITLGLTALLCWATPTAAQSPDDDVLIEPYSISANDFDLEAVVSLIQDERVKNAEDLERIINEDNGINNVDSDGDGYVDYIAVQEWREGDETGFEFVAIPASSEGEVEPRVTTIASMSFTAPDHSEHVHVVATYPDYVLHPGFGYSATVVATHGFATWVYWPYRPMIGVSYVVVGYQPRPICGREVLVTRRATFRSTYPSSRRVTRVVRTVRRGGGVTTRHRVARTRGRAAVRTTTRRDRVTRSGRRERLRRGGAISPRSNRVRRDRVRGDRRATRRDDARSSRERDRTRATNARREQVRPRRVTDARQEERSRSSRERSNTERREQDRSRRDTSRVDSRRGSRSTTSRSRSNTSRSRSNTSRSRSNTSRSRDRSRTSRSRSRTSRSRSRSRSSRSRGRSSRGRSRGSRSGRSRR